jgi:hypothetical protein
LCTDICAEYARRLDFWGLVTEIPHICLAVSAEGPRWPVHFTVHRKPQNQHTVCPQVVLCGTCCTTSIVPSQLNRFWQAPRQRPQPYLLSMQCFTVTTH